MPLISTRANCAAELGGIFSSWQISKIPQIMVWFLRLHRSLMPWCYRRRRLSRRLFFSMQRRLFICSESCTKWDTCSRLRQSRLITPRQRELWIPECIQSIQNQRICVLRGSRIRRPKTISHLLGIRSEQFNRLFYKASPTTTSSKRHGGDSDKDFGTT